MAKKRIQGITIALDADTSGITKGLKDVVKQTNSVSGELRQVDRLLKLSPDNVELLAQKQQLLSKQVELTTSKLGALKGAQKDVENQFKNGSIGEEEYRTFQREIVATEAKLDSYKNSLAQVKDSSGNAGEATNGLSGKVDNLGDSVDTVGTAIKGGVLVEAADQLSAIGDKIVEIAQNAQEFAMTSEKSYGKFYANTNLSGQALEELKGVAQDVFATGMTDSIEEATDATTILKSAFNDLSNSDLTHLTSDVLKLAERTGTDVQENVRAAKKMMSAFGISAEEAFDFIASGFKNNLNASGDFLDTIDEYSTHFKTAGYDASDMLQILKNGLENGAQNTDKAADAIKEMQVRLGDGSFENSLETFSNRTKEVFEQWKQGKATTADVARSVEADIKKMSPNEQQAALSALSSQFEDLGLKASTSLLNIGTEFDNVNGKLDEATQKTNAENWQEAVNQIQQALMPIGTDILNALLPVLDFLADLASWFTNLPGPIKTFVESFGGILAVATLLLPVITAIIALFALFGSTVGVVIGVIVGIIAIISAIISAIKNWGSITDWLGEKWKAFLNGLSIMFDQAKDKAKSIVDSITGFFGSMKLSLPELKFPKIKLPHFSFDGSFNLLKGQVPKVSVDWFANGGILTKPTIFGQNGSSLMAGGEAGKEAVAPLSDLMSYVEKAVANQMGGKGDEIHLHLTTYGTIPKETMDQMAEYFMYRFTDLKKQKGLG